MLANDKYHKKHIIHPFKFSFLLIIIKTQNWYQSNYEILIISCCDAVSPIYKGMISIFPKLRDHIGIEYEDSVCCPPIFSRNPQQLSSIFQYYGYTTDSSTCLIFTNWVYLLSLLNENTDWLYVLNTVYLTVLHFTDFILVLGMTHFSQCIWSFKEITD